MLYEVITISLFYGLSSFLLSYLVSLPLGILKALRHNSRFDSLSSMLIYTGYALPAYVVGIFLITLFSYNFV